MMAIVISGFAGVGKTTAQRQYPYPAFDLDPAKFAGPHYPKNYLDEVKRILAKAEHPNTLIFVSTHPKVREALLAAKIPFVLVFPGVECKGEYLNRLQAKGMSPNAFSPIMYNWDVLVEELSLWGIKNNVPRVILREGQTILDVIPTIKTL